MFHFCNIVLDVAEYATSTAYDLEEFSLLHRSFNDRLLGIVQKNEALIHERYRPFYDNVLKGEKPYLFFLYRRERKLLEQERTRSEGHALETRKIEQWARTRIDDLEQALSESREQTRRAQEEIANVRASKSYRIGNFFMRGPAAVKRALRSKSEKSER